VTCQEIHYHEVNGNEWEPERRRPRLIAVTRRLLAISVASVMALAGQGASVRADPVPAPAPATLDSLAGHHWDLRTVTQHGQVWVAPQNPGLWLAFGLTTWSGQDGCNDQAGSATYTATGVQLAKATATTFVCHGDDSQHMVTAFAALLQAPATVALAEGVLTLTAPGESLTFRDTSAPAPPDSLVGKLVGWYWRIQSTSVNGVRTVTPKGSRAAINFTDQDFDASDDCGNDYTGATPVTYTDGSMTLPSVEVSAVGCPQTPLDDAYDKVLQSGTLHLVVDGTTLTLSRGGATLVYVRGPAAAYKSDFLAGPPPKPLTAARVAASVEGPTWQVNQVNRGTEYWRVPTSYGALATFGRTSFAVTYGCVTWSGPITYTAFGATATPHKTTGSCAQTVSDRKVDAAVTLLLGDTFTVQGGGRFRLLTGGGVYLDLSTVLPAQPPIVIAPKYLKRLLVGKPWTVTAIGKGRVGALVPAGVKASLTFTGKTFTAKAGCVRITGRLSYTAKGASLAPLHRTTTCALSREVATVVAAYEKVLRGLPKYGLGYGNSQFSLTAGGSTLVLGRYGP
jgi:heat shock protein HslJ